MIHDKYTAGLVSQSFWFIEFKKIINLIEIGKTEEEIKKICLEENLFGVAKEYRAKRIFGYIWKRVKQLDKAMMKLFLYSDIGTQKLINLICILKTDRLFFEFTYEVYREKAILGFEKIEVADISTFFNRKEVQNVDIFNWTEGTKKKLGRIYMNFMIDANLLKLENNEKNITVPILDKSLKEYLETTDNNVLVKALTGER